MSFTFHFVSRSNGTHVRPFHPLTFEVHVAIHEHRLTFQLSLYFFLWHRRVIKHNNETVDSDISQLIQSCIFFPLANTRLIWMVCGFDYFPSYTRQCYMTLLVKNCEECFTRMWLGKEHQYQPGNNGGGDIQEVSNGKRYSKEWDRRLRYECNFLPNIPWEKISIYIPYQTYLSQFIVIACNFTDISSNSMECLLDSARVFL